jgi:hypothetical protein
MMRTVVNIVLFITLAGLLSCGRGTPKQTDIIGKWWSYKTTGKEYSEYDIDKNTMGIFMYPAGNGGRSDYELVNDTLIFRGLKFKVEMLSGDQFTLTFYDKIDTLTRLPDSVVTFHSVPHMNDSAYKIFYDSFQQRAFDAEKKR